MFNIPHKCFFFCGMGENESVVILIKATDFLAHARFCKSDSNSTRISQKMSQTHEFHLLLNTGRNATQL